MDLESFETEDQVQLTQAEEKWILEQARSNKVAKWREFMHWKRVREGRKIPVFSSEELLNAVIRKFEKTTGMHWVMTSELQPIMLKMAKYFNSDQSCELDTRKGLLLFGGVGCGKTTIMRMFSDNPKASYFVYPCRNIASAFARDSYEGIEPYYDLVSRPENTFGHTTYGACFDDLGTESSVRNFGNQANVMEEVILSRYDRGQGLWNRTHMTTNQSAEDLKSLYGERCTSRMREMFNMIDFSEIQDFRK